jgi:hypothetical protein
MTDHYPYAIEVSGEMRDANLEGARLSTAMMEVPAALPTNSSARKRLPMCSGLLDYFPAALAEVSKVSHVSNEQHNGTQKMHWARGKSTDHSDCILRHLVERGEIDSDGMRHTAKVAWRALALLQEELEADGAKPGRASRWPS